jgi:hypothetical protein
VGRRVTRTNSEPPREFSGRLPPDARPLGLDLGGVTVEEAGTRVLRAVDEGRLSIPEGAKLGTLLKDMIAIREVGAFRVQIEAAKKEALEMARASRSLVPAAKQTVDTTPESAVG